MGSFDNDYLYEDLSDLINNQPDPVTGRTFRGWYMKAFYTLGKDEVLKLAGIARADGKDKKKYFSRLLRQSLSKQQAYR